KRLAHGFLDVLGRGDAVFPDPVGLADQSCLQAVQYESIRLLAYEGGHMPRAFEYPPGVFDHMCSSPGGRANFDQRQDVWRRAGMGHYAALASRQFLRKP